MVKYLIDANVIIQAKNEYYDFGSCLGFLRWLEEQNSMGNVASIEDVQEEVSDYGDEPAEWAKSQGRVFFFCLQIKPC